MARNANPVSLTSGIKRPDFRNIVKSSRKFKRNFESAMFYAQYELTDKRLKTESFKYVKAKKLDIKAIDALPAYHFSIVGKICYILNNKGEVDDEWQLFIDGKFNELVEIGNGIILDKKKEEALKKLVNVVSIQERLRNMAESVASEFDSWIDEFISDPKSFKSDKYDPYSEMLVGKLKAVSVKHILTFYENDISELKEVIVGEDDELNAGYKIYTKLQLKELLKLYEAIVNSANMIIDAAKVERKLGETKSVSADVLVGKLKYTKKDTNIGLVSINPRNIIGAKQLWVYNIKTRKVGQYIALDSDGLSVKGTTILNFSNKSVEKTLRKPIEQLKGFKKLSKVVLRTYMDEIATIDIKLNGRINNNHILLRVI